MALGPRVGQACPMASEISSFRLILVYFFFTACLHPSSCPKSVVSGCMCTHTNIVEQLTQTGVSPCFNLSRPDYKEGGTTGPQACSGPPGIQSTLSLLQNPFPSGEKMESPESVTRSSRDHLSPSQTGFQDFKSISLLCCSVHFPTQGREKACEV